MPKGKRGNKGRAKGKPRKSGPAVSAKGQLGKGIMKRRTKDEMSRKEKLKEDGPDIQAMGLHTAGSRLVSVTDTSTVEDFMATAAMAERSFAAERRMHGEFDELVMLGDDGEVVAMGEGAAAEAAKPDITNESGVLPLQVPRRPAWTEGMSAKELHKRENKSFLAWRRALAEQEEQHTSSIASGAGGELGGVAVTPFEKNIEMWRQLWRVVERSDVVVQVVDARQPLLYHCPDVEAYAKEINPLKQTLLLVNKADFLSPRQRFEWGLYLHAEGIRFAFFSAHAELKKLEDEARQTSKIGVDVFVALEQGADLRGDGDEDEEDEDEEGSTARASDDAESDDDGDTASDADSAGAEKGGKGGSVDLFATPQDAEAERRQAEEEAVAAELGLSEDMRHECRIMDRQDLLDFLRDEYEWLRAHVTAGSLTAKAAAKLEEEASKARRRQEAIAAAEAEADALGGFSAEALGPATDTRDAESSLPASDLESSTAAPAVKKVGFALDDSNDGDGEQKVKWAQEVSDTAAASEALAEVEGRKLVIGTVGYPNVGKSSVINALLGVTSSSHHQKRAGVGATPGKTKHFQTLSLSHDMTLCDCPGLVFPSFVSTRAEMVVAGVLPVDEMRQHYPPVALVCRRIPRETLERLYGIKIRKPGMVEDQHRPPHPRELLDALCHMRGFMASTHAGPDHPRGSRLILKDFLSGSLLFVHPPPQLPDSRRERFLAETSPERAIVLGQDPQQAADHAEAKSSAGIGWSENVLLPSAAGARPEPPRAVDGVVSKTQAQSSSASALREPSDDDVGPSDADGAAADDMTDAEMEALVAEDELLFGDLQSFVGAHGGEGEAASASQRGRRQRIKGLGRRRLRKGERDPDPYGTQVTEEEMLLGMVDEAHKATRHARARAEVVGSTSGVDARVMSGSSSAPSGVGKSTSFTRVSRVYASNK